MEHKLEELTTWTPKELDNELSTWSAEALTKLWTLLEGSFKGMCRAFGIASPRKRVSHRGIRTHQQMKRLAVLRRHAMPTIE